MNNATAGGSTLEIIQFKPGQLINIFNALECTIRERPKYAREYCQLKQEIRQQMAGNRKKAGLPFHPSWAREKLSP